MGDLLASKAVIRFVWTTLYRLKLLNACDSCSFYRLVFAFARVKMLCRKTQQYLTREMENRVSCQTADVEGFFLLNGMVKMQRAAAMLL